MEITQQETSFQLGLLYFFYMLDQDGGLLDEPGHQFAYNILDEENLSTHIFHRFILEIWGKTESEIYQSGVEYIRACSFENRLRLFSRLYQVANIIGYDALSEVRSLFYLYQQSGNVLKKNQGSEAIQADFTFAASSFQTL